MGCGNGYYALRMLDAGARWVLGAEPTQLFGLQYEAIRRFTPPLPFWLLPAPLEDVPEPPAGLDTVFSMGVLYHRRSPFGHLARLRRWLRPGGELVLETLVVEGGPETVLVPRGRYARMRNVWFLPSVAALTVWLERAGFHDVRCVDVTATRTAEQRSTEWMPFQSLQDALDPGKPGAHRRRPPGPAARRIHRRAKLSGAFPQRSGGRHASWNVASSAPGERISQTAPPSVPESGPL